jgi:membrane-bound lytic murein transglycosylase A
VKNKLPDHPRQIQNRQNQYRGLGILGKIILALVLIFLAGCGILTDREQVEVPEPALEKLTGNRYPDFSDTFAFSGFLAALDQSLVYYQRLPASRMVDFGPDQYTAAHMIASLKTLRAFLETGPPASEVNRFVRDRFHVYAGTANEKDQVLFTGYFEPTYRGSLVPDERFPYPLYPVPSDLVEIDLSKFSDRYQGHDRLRGRVAGNQVVPYFSRKQINQKSDFHLQARPVAWLENRVDRFFLEIQGSGRIQTPENGIVRSRYQRQPLPVHRPVPDRQSGDRPGTDVHAGHPAVAGRQSPSHGRGAPLQRQHGVLQNRDRRAFRQHQRDVDPASVHGHGSPDLSQRGPVFH